MLYVGAGVIHSNASGELFEFARKAHIPVTTTLLGLGVFPETDPLSFGMLGVHGFEYTNYAVAQCDCLIGVGARFDDRVTGKPDEFARKAKKIHIDVDPSSINKTVVVDFPIVGDVKQVLQELLKLLGPLDTAEWVKTIGEMRKKYPLVYREKTKILPQYIIQQISEATKGDAIIATGVGQHQMWAAQYFRFNSPRNWVTSGGLGSMGFGLPSALGAQAAHPSKLVVDIDGDGSFLMNIQELATAYCEKLPVKVLLLNNQHLGMVVQWEDRFYESNRGHTYLGAGFDQEPYPDFVEIARGFRCGAREVVRKEDLDEALEEMLDSKLPYLLDVLVPYQEHVLPMIPGGMTVRDIIKA